MLRKSNKRRWQLAVVFLLICFPVCVFGLQSAEAKSRSAVISSQSCLSIKQAFSAVYKGDIASARRLIEEDAECKSEAADSLKQIISEFEQIESSRQSAQKTSYTDKLVELEKLQAEADVNGLEDTNDIVSILAAVAVVSEFADEQQKSDLLSSSFVKEVTEKAMEKAGEFESQGKWLDSYISCYSWLQNIYKDNQAYSDYSDELFEKADIVASFQDSPCETSEERYLGIKKGMLDRAVQVLNYNYVSIPDYGQMASKAIRRCQLLAEVMANPNVREDTKYQIKDSKITAWKLALDGLLGEVKNSPLGVSKDKFMQIFENVLLINKATVGLPEPVLIVQFANSAFSTLDPHTVMIWPKQVQDFEKNLSDEFTGIGIEIGKPKGLLTVGSLLPDTPAYNSGLDAGDIIEKVDGLETKEMSLGCAVKRITGPKGTKVKLTIRRPGEEQTRDIVITRDKIVVSTIRGWQRTESGNWLYMVDEKSGIGYIRVRGFSAETTPDFERVLERLEAKGLKGLILDLRYNSGGLLSCAIEISDKFLNEGLIVRTRPRWQVGTFAAATQNTTHPDYPLVVLINSFSASASEIVAGALQDPKHKRATLVGERTYGKGSVQTITTYPGGRAQLKYTMAYYHLPSGQRVESQDAMKKLDRDDWGVGPDVSIKLRSDERRKKYDLQKDNDVLVRADHDNVGKPMERHSIEETLQADIQLAVGVLIVRAKQIEAGMSSGNKRASF